MSSERLENSKARPILRSPLFRLLLLLGTLAAISLGLYLSPLPSSFKSFAGAVIFLSGIQVVWALVAGLKVRANSSERDAVTPLVRGGGDYLDEKLQALEGRMLSRMSFIMGEFGVDPDNPLRAVNEGALQKAIFLARDGYVLLRKFGGPSEYLALNNYVYYSTVAGDVTRSDELLDHAYRLLKAGQEHDAKMLQLTACAAILRFSDSRHEKSRAREVLEAIAKSPNSRVKEVEEARFYLSHLWDLYDDVSPVAGD